MGRCCLILVRVLLAVFLLIPPALAIAHTRSESNAVWEIDGAQVDLVMTIAGADAQRLSPQGPPPSDPVLKQYLASRTYPIAEGRRCAVVPPIETLSAQPGYRKFDFTFGCAATKAIQIHSGAFFELIPSHVDFAQIQNAATQEFTEQLITGERQTVDVTLGAGSPLQEASFLDFMRMGIMHIFTGVDHMAFLVGLVLISRNLRDLVFVVTGFTIGHSMTLALAVTGVLRPHADYIDALVALTIALIGAENIAVATRKPELVAGALAGFLGLMALLRWAGFGALPPLLLVGSALFTANYLLVSGHVRDAGRLRLVITLLFGLIHGFGFAANLLELQLPTGRLAELLVGFNLGVEAGQLTLVLSVSLLAYGLGRVRLAPPRAVTVEVASAMLMCLGCYWFLGRSFV